MLSNETSWKRTWGTFANKFCERSISKSENNLLNWCGKDARLLSCKFSEVKWMVLANIDAGRTVKCWCSSDKEPLPIALPINEMYRTTSTGHFLVISGTGKSNSSASNVSTFKCTNAPNENGRHLIGLSWICSCTIRVSNLKQSFRAETQLLLMSNIVKLVIRDRLSGSSKIKLFETFNLIRFANRPK